MPDDPEISRLEALGTDAYDDSRDSWYEDEYEYEPDDDGDTCDQYLNLPWD